MAFPGLPGPMEEAEKFLLAFLQTKVGEGISFLKKERSFTEMPKAMRFIEGEQVSNLPKALSKTSDNRLKKILLETVSALTDVRPIWNYRTENEKYEAQADILNKLARGWWKNNAVDRRLQSVLSYSGVGGSGYGALTWDPELPGGGDFRLVPYDPRDVIPIDPVYSDSIQDWRGVVLRERLPIETVKAMFPLKAYKVDRDAGSWFSPIMRDSGRFSDVVSSVWSFLTSRQGDRDAGKDYVDLMRVWIKDPAIHKGEGPILMGDPESNWKYWVYPVGFPKPDGSIASVQDAMLYPRGRLIVCTASGILEDGPNPYWHGMFPIVRFTLDPLPWLLLGSSMILELIPLQNALNEGLRGLEDGMGQWVNRGVVADKTATAGTNLDKLDTRAPGLRVKVNPTVAKPFEVIDGPTFPTWYMEYLGLLKQEIDELSGVRGLQQLAQMKQMPSSDTMEKYMDALSPLLRLRARSIEISLGELAEMLKVGFFQYYDADRRMQILGQDGLSLEDFDYDPDNLIPAETEEEAKAPRQERAEKHHRNFTFSIAPNSFLQVSHMTQKMLMLQLMRAGMVDPWTALATFDLANVGEPPAETIMERLIEAKRLGLSPGPPPEVVQAQTSMALMQAQQMQMQMQQMAAMAMMQPGAQAGAPPPGGGGNPQAGVGPQGGRPPSGQQPPQMIMKDGGSRMVVSESGSGGQE